MHTNQMIFLALLANQLATLHNREHVLQIGIIFSYSPFSLHCSIRDTLLLLTLVNRD